MVHLIDDFIPKAKDKPSEVITEPRKLLRGDDNVNKPSLLDKLILLIAVIYYFRYTGKAVATGQKIPRSWLELDVVKRIRKIKESLDVKKVYIASKEEDKKEPPKTKFRVVDIATNEPVKIAQS